MPDLITMDGEYAYACDPYTKARILCVDAPGDQSPVLSVNAAGNVYRHLADGTYRHSAHRNLVPLQRRPKPVEAWAVVDGHGVVLDIGVVREYVRGPQPAHPGNRLVRLIEDQEWRP
jgi:hypothetical protein